MKWKICTMIPAITVGVMLFCAVPCWAFSFQAVGKTYLAKVEAKARQLSAAVEHLQEDIVEELSGVKEKQLFQQADQVLHELVKMEKLLGKTTLAREDLYKQFDSIDGKVTVLQKAVSKLASKHPVLLRDADRVHALTHDLHFVVSEGDVSPERFHDILARQAKAMSAVTKKLSLAAQFALGDVPGRGELLDDMQKLADACGKFEKVVATTADLDKCKKEFSTLNKAWKQVVQGMSLLPPMGHVYLLRVAGGADTIHERLFQTLGIKGKRTALTIDI